MTATTATVRVGKTVSRRRGSAFIARFRRQKVAMSATVTLLLVIAVAALAPWVAPYDPLQQDLSNGLRPPFTGGHLLGTDEFGRDVLSRLIFGARYSLFAAVQAVGIGLMLGLIPGLVAGYVTGKLDWLTMRVVDALMAFPPIMLAISVVAALGPGLTNAMIAVGIVFAPRITRMARDATLQVRGETFVEAANSMGATSVRTLLRHVVPHVLSPMIVLCSILAGQAMVIEAGLSFIGLGVAPPKASWGSNLSSAFQYNENAPFLIIWPGLCIVVTVMSLNLMGDGIRDSVGRESRNA